MPRRLEPSRGAIEEAVRRLRGGDVVAFPTETVYGLGADAGSETGLAEIYRRKGRPLDNPMIAHVGSVEQAHALASSWDERCERLAERFWPGPLTLVVPKAPAVSDRLTAGLDTVAVRAPDHDVARRLLEALGAPIVAPSANRSGHVSPTTAQHVADDFAEDEALLILDGGPCRVGIESTVLAIGAVDGPVRILRPGAVSADALRELIGEVETAVMQRQGASPGTSSHHYAPSAPCELVPSDEIDAQLRAEQRPVAVLCFDASRVEPPHHAYAMSHDDAEYAADLYAALRRADALSPSQIIVETPPETSGLWRAVHDRLRRAVAS